MDAGLPKLDVRDSLSAVGGCNQSSSLPTFVMDMPSSEIPAVGGCVEPALGGELQGAVTIPVWDPDWFIIPLVIICRRMGMGFAFAIVVL